MNSNKIELCRKIQSNINNLCPNEIDEIFKILHKNNSNYTKNNNGIFVNLNWIDDEILEQLNNYIESENAFDFAQFTNIERKFIRDQDIINNIKLFI